jgi:heme-degrading monooxygenase HmoA
MYVIIWEYQVRAERLAEFEEIYSASGAWARLFQNSEGFLGTELLRDEAATHRYLTIDGWRASRDYEAFLQQWQTEYAALDRQCEGLTNQETLLGKWESISRGTR